MLKFTYLAQLGLAGTMLVPAVVLEQDPAGGLTDALANTRASIASLERLHTSLTQGDYDKVSTTLEATEAPDGASQERDEHLYYLRGEVSRLQMRWDALYAALGAKVTAPTTPKAAGALVPTPTTTPTPNEIAATTTGLNQGVREELERQFSNQEEGASTSFSHEKTSYEPVGFTAHAVRHGRAYYKAERYEEALAHLEQSGEQAGALFWKACTLEKLGRTADAISAFQDVIDSPLEAEHAEHARRNRDFLVWKRDFDARIAETSLTINSEEFE